MLNYEAAQQLTAAIVAVDGVAAMGRGRFGNVLTRFGGQQVPGLKLVGGVLRIELVADFSASRDLRHVSEDVRQLTLAALGSEHPDVAEIDIVFSDVAAAPLPPASAQPSVSPQSHTASTAVSGELLP